MYTLGRFYNISVKYLCRKSLETIVVTLIPALPSNVYNLKAFLGSDWAFEYNPRVTPFISKSVSNIQFG